MNRFIEKNVGGWGGKGLEEAVCMRSTGAGGGGGVGTWTDGPQIGLLHQQASTNGTKGMRR